MRDWGNTFNKAASKPSFVEHLQSLDHIEPAVLAHMATAFSPPRTSSHPDYEKDVHAFVQKVYPGRFQSQREYQAASLFRKRMVEHGLWTQWLKWCCEHVDFSRASEVDAGAIYKVANVYHP